MNRNLLVIAIVLIFAIPAPPRAEQRHVPSEYGTIAAGLAASVPGDTVTVACGTYYEHELAVPSGVTLRSETGSWDCVVIDAQIQGSVFHFDHATDVTLDGLTIRNGYAEQGGGFLIAFSEFTLRRCRLTGSTGTRGSAALHASHCDALIEFCLIDANSNLGGYNGSIVGLAAGSGTMRNCTVAANSGSARLIRVGAGLVHVEHVIHEGLKTDEGGEITTFCTFGGDPAYCDPAAEDFRLLDGSPCLPGGLCTELIGALPGCETPPVPVTLVLSASEPAIPIIVDNVEMPGPVVVQWDPYSLHRLDAPPQQLVSDGIRATFREWSDDPDAPRHRDYWVPSHDGNVVAQYDLDFLLDVHAEKHGTVNAVSGWHAEGATIVIAADPDPGYYFDRWVGSGPGSYTGADPSTSITPAGPVVQTAWFRRLEYDFTVSTSDTDPWQNEAPPANGIRTLHLWLTCASGGVSAVEFFSGGTLLPVGFSPTGGVLNAGDPWHLLLAIPNCPTGTTPIRLGSWQVFDTGGSFCPNMLRPSPAAVGGAVDCHLIHAVLDPEARITGFSSNGQPPCVAGDHGCSDLPPGPDPGAPTAAVEPEFRTVRLSAHPNPFRSRTRISWAAPADAHPSLVVFDVLGRRVRTLVGGPDEGLPPVEWDGRDDRNRPLPAGVYFVRMESAAGSLTRKVTRLGPD